MPTLRGRHRAQARPFHWASRSVVATAAVPVGALAGCVAAAASSSQPMLGLAGLTVAAVPLALHAWHTRRAERSARLPGRHTVAGSGLEELFAAVGPAGELHASSAFEPTWPASRIPAPRGSGEAIDLLENDLDAAMSDEASLDDADGSMALWPTRAERDAEIAKLRQLWDTSAPTPAPVKPSSFA